MRGQYAEPRNPRARARVAGVAKAASRTGAFAGALIGAVTVVGAGPGAAQTVAGDAPPPAAPIPAAPNSAASIPAAQAAAAPPPGPPAAPSAEADAAGARDAVRPEGSLEDYAIWDGGPSMGGAWIAHPQARGAIAVTVETPDGRRVETRLMGLRGSARRTGFVVSADLARALGLTPGAPLRLTAIPTEAAPQVARAGSGTPPAHRAPAPLVASPPERPGQGPRIAALPADRPAEAAAPGLIPPPEPSRIPRDPRVAAPEASPAPPARPAAAPLQARPRPFDTTAVPSPSGPGAGPSIKAPA